jgi:hypothetical protein
MEYARPRFAILPLLLASVLSSLPANAANLKPETVAAWNEYLETAKANLKKRVAPGGVFLWSMEDPDRAAKVKMGQIVVSAAPGAAPKKVPGGLIHHWIGAMFVPNVKLDQVLDVTRDYERYKDYYRPSVIESRTLARGDTADRFSMRLMNKAFFLKTALDADYESTIQRVDERRIYSISQTSRVQEIERCGELGEHALPDGQGGGYIWRMFSIARYEQKDSGVYFEFEAVALSRDIPAAAHLFVDPIVRRVSRNSLLVSLRQTEGALRENLATEAKKTASPAETRSTLNSSSSYESGASKAIRPPR